MAKVRTARWGHRAEAKESITHPQVQRQLDEAEALSMEDMEALAKAVNEAYTESERNDTTPLMEVRQRYLDTCQECDGSGILDGEWRCHQCDGTGWS